MAMSVGESDALLTGAVVGRLEKLLNALKGSCSPLEESIEDMRWHVSESPECPDLSSADAMLAEFEKLVALVKETCPVIEEALETLRWNDAWRRESPEQQVIAMKRRAEWLSAAGDEEEARLWLWEAARREKLLAKEPTPAES